MELGFLKREDRPGRRDAVAEGEVRDKKWEKNGGKLCKNDEQRELHWIFRGRNHEEHILGLMMIDVE